MITIEFDHRLAEHQRAHLLFRAGPLRAHAILAVLAAVLGLVQATTAGVEWWTAAMFSPALGIAGVRLVLIPLVTRHLFRRTPKFHEHTTVTFSDEHVHYKTPSIDSILDWSLFSGLIEDDQLFLLRYKAPQSYAVVPRRAFASQTAIDDFRDLVHRKLTRRAA